MTRQTWTAFVSAVVFVALAALLAVVPVPFVSWSPGGTQDTLGTVGGQPIIRISGIGTFPTPGRLDLTTVSITRADSHLTLPEAVLSYWLAHRDTLPRDAVYDPGKSAAQVETEESDEMSTAQDQAVVAALRAAGQPVTELPVVTSVSLGGPAHGKLLPGDLVQLVDGVPTRAADAAGEQIRTHRIGEKVRFVVLRDKRAVRLSVVTTESTSEAGKAMVGVQLGTGYRYRPVISFELGQEIGGPSAGLVFALAIYDKITEGPLLAGAHVAGTGTITPTGDVGAIGGAQEKVAAAADDGATAFLVPAANCPDLVGLTTDLTVVPVDTLGDAITAVRTLETPGGAERLPHC